MLSYAKTQAVQLAQGCISVFQRPLNNNLATAEQVQAFIANTEFSSELTSEQLEAAIARAGPGRRGLHR